MTSAARPPLVSCIMPTANRRRFVPKAIEYFLAQDYAEKELVVLDDGDDRVEDLIPADPRIRYLRGPRRQPIGTKRNVACEAARGDIIVHWDDDDWSAPWRLGYQVRELLDNGSDVCGLDRVLFVDTTGQQAWEYVYPKSAQPWVYGATFCYRKPFWRRNPFPDVQVGEDSRFVWNARGAHIRALPDNGFYVGLVHDTNTSRKQVADPRWHRRPVTDIEAIMRTSVPTASVAKRAPSEGSGRRPAALVSAALGIGDILRVTPLVRVFHGLGFDVDMLVAPDSPGTAQLLEGAPEIRRVIVCSDFQRNRGSRPIAGLADRRYDLATFSTWSEPLSRWVRTKTRHAFDRASWVTEGDTLSIERIARAAGWQGPLPEPFAMASDRAFDLPPGTIALHPGCKHDWPWKKWHGFGELAALFPHVAIVGTDTDLDTSGTYFRAGCEWPVHALNFVGRLDLRDTAALLRQCAALVANDSGLMHLGVALGIPTFGIFGITSPQREAMRSRWMTPISKGLPCETPCRQLAWGRRDCDHHLACLKQLTATEVAVRVRETLAADPRAARRPTPDDRSVRVSETPAPQERPVDKIRLNYFGYVFDASGYGQAARAYIHALHGAGIDVSVVDIGAQPAQVEDELVRSLVGRHPDPDFNLLHGIPPQWAHLAFPLRNVIAMTVWETDTMPPRWRSPLAHAIDVWLPCRFNVDVFGRALGRPPFRLPHCVPPTGLNGTAHATMEQAALGIAPSDFVFYSIFEWQDRKNPDGLLRAFLTAFPEENDAVLVIKANPGAADAAVRALGQARATTRSQGRVVLCCEAWDDTRLHALHDRGNCYVSLHKGEGWGYPLFEAACRGKPVVATAYSGPLDFLDADHHCLVSCSPAPVRQPYVYYQPTMRWAEPDLAQAAEALRRVHADRVPFVTRAQEAAKDLRVAYSPSAVGAAARSRLLSLLKRTDANRWHSIDAQERARRASPEVPIPGAWYDADYFEHGLKSNWDQGYTWPLFKGVFEDAAAYLTDVFTEAVSYLDAGCAKGFLVRALRDRGKTAFGFDHSPWAIEHADPTVRPFLRLASADTVHYEDTFDILVAFSLLESLTEAQIDAFLPRARAWTRQAVIAFIPTLPDGERRDGPGRKGDLAHITLRDRAWWHERFIAAGWRQDALHRIVEQQCREHALPRRMSWDIYVYAP